MFLNENIRKHNQITESNVFDTQLDFTIQARKTTIAINLMEISNVKGIVDLIYGISMHVKNIELSYNLQLLFNRSWNRKCPMIGNSQLQSNTTEICVNGTNQSEESIFSDRNCYLTILGQ